jgi:hypothetical protein
MSIDKIILLQRKYKIKRIETVLLLFKQKINQLHFDNYNILSKEIQNKELLNLTNILLFRINRYLNPEKKTISRKQSRILLSSYILKHHTKQVFTCVDINFRYQLKCIASDLINYIENDLLKYSSYKNFSLNRFGHIYNTYYINYEELLKLDKIGLINELVLEYYNTTITINKIESSEKYDDEQKSKSTINLKNHLHQIKMEIKLLDPNFNDDLN